MYQSICAQTDSLWSIVNEMPPKCFQLYDVKKVFINMFNSTCLNYKRLLANIWLYSCMPKLYLSNLFTINSSDNQGIYIFSCFVFGRTNCYKCHFAVLKFCTSAQTCELDMSLAMCSKITTPCYRIYILDAFKLRHMHSVKGKSEMHFLKSVR